MNLWCTVSKAISQHTQTPFEASSHHSIAGGCINQAYQLSDGQRRFFVKVNSPDHGDMFTSEALALEEMQASACVRVPQPICYGKTSTQAYIVLENLSLTGHINPVELAQQLAAMHRNTQPEFGWCRDNTIGSTPQYNKLSENWIDFWRDQRLLPQLALIEKNGYAGELFPLTDKLLANFHNLFNCHNPEASMLHGDLWGGNAAALEDGTAVIFDPALYYGDRETDIAMTSLFGGFSESFYAAYHEAWPLEDGFAVRKIFYNLYHILNHLNLFGRGYLGQAISMTERVLAEI